MKQLKMLNVGCGDYYDPRWTNIDIYSPSPLVIKHDITKGLPFPDNSFDVVYHSHILEHLSRGTATDLIRECYRVLTPEKGILRVVIPDLEFSCTLYLQSLADARREPSPVNHEHYEWAMLNLLDQMVRTRSGGEMTTFLGRKSLHDLDFVIQNGGGTVVKQIRDSLALKPLSTTQKLTRMIRSPQRWKTALRRQLGSLLGTGDYATAAFLRLGERHMWMYDDYSLSVLLEQVGFREIKRQSPHESSIPEWGKYQLDVRADNSVHKPMSLFMEARK
jgi:predicted SAM-dependent methyltransferase